MAEIEPEATDFLGRSVPIAFKNQPALPAAGGAPVGASAAPAAPGGTGALVGGGGAAETGKGPSGALAEALRAIQLGGKFGDIARRTFGGDTATAPATTGGTTPSQDLLGPSGRFGETPTGGELGLTIDAPAADVPIDAFGAGVDPGGTAGMAAGETALAGPILSAAANVLRGIPTYEQIANSTYSDAEKVILISTLLGAKGSEGFFSPFTFGAPLGLSEGTMSFFRNIFGDPPLTHRQRELIGEGGVISGFNQMAPIIEAAQTPEDIWQAFEPTTTENFRTGKHSGYPIFASGEDITEASLMKALTSGDPNALSFAYQAGVEPGVLEQLNTGLNTTVRNQMSLINAAQQGDPKARQILSQRKAARDAELATNEQAHLAFLREPYWGYTGDAP